jgi:predicted O-linked N-acetylglucosamine transferase (SPINDLY family)
MHSKQNSLTVPQALQIALEHHQAGHLPEAERLYQSVLQADPDNADALHLLGVIARQVGKSDISVQFIDRAIRKQPGNPDFLNSRGLALQALEGHDEALASFDKALAGKPDNPGVLLNRGNALHELGRYEEALAGYEQALALQPDYAEALFSRGNALHQLDRYEEAITSHDRALALQPSHVRALFNRGTTLQKLQRYDDALASFEQALALQPQYVEALTRHGLVLQVLSRYDEAFASYEHALALKPDHAEAWFCRGIALQECARYDEALASFERALQIRPDYVEVLSSCGLTLAAMGRYAEAVKTYERLLQLDPDYDYALGFLLHFRLHLCDWTDYAESANRTTAGVRVGKNVAQPFAFLTASDSAQDQLLCSSRYIANKFPTSLAPLWQGERYCHDRIRIAYLSADLREHPASYLLAGVFERHNRARFETIAVSFGPDDGSEMRARLQGAFERFVDVRTKSDREIAQLLRDLEIDIAVDLMGFTRESRTGIFALRPAPIQVNFFCPCTSGADYIDYIVIDQVVVPQQHRAYYAEQVVYLPDTFQANDSGRRVAAHAPTRAEAGLPEDGFVFCCFNNSYKFTPEVFDVWMRLLLKVAGSVLWLPQLNAQARDNLRREAASRGVDTERLLFAPRTRLMEDHLARYRLADLFLDTLPYNAQATASDALWAGLPVLTRLGGAFVGRVAASLLHAIGLPELITHSLEEYEALALKLATDPDLLAGIRTKLAHNRDTHPLFDTDRFRHHMEAAYSTMWERHQRGEPPAGFAVQPILASAPTCSPSA